MLTDKWIEEQLQICEAASQGPWRDGFDDGSGRIADDDHSGAYITFGEADSYGLTECVVKGGDHEGIPIGVLKQEDVDFIIAAREGYLLVLKEVQRLKQVIYRACEDLRMGESGHAAKTLDDDREPGTKSYYD